MFYVWYGEDTYYYNSRGGVYRGQYTETLLLDNSLKRFLQYYNRNQVHVIMTKTFCPTIIYNLSPDRHLVCIVLHVLLCTNSKCDSRLCIHFRSSLWHEIAFNNILTFFGKIHSKIIILVYIEHVSSSLFFSNIGSWTLHPNINDHFPIFTYKALPTPTACTFKIIFILEIYIFPTTLFDTSKIILHIFVVLSPIGSTMVRGHIVKHSMMTNLQH